MIYNQLCRLASVANSTETRANAMADRQAVMSEALDTGECDQPPCKKNTRSVSPILVSLIALVHGWFTLFDRLNIISLLVWNSLE